MVQQRPTDSELLAALLHGGYGADRAREKIDQRARLLRALGRLGELMHVVTHHVPHRLAQVPARVRVVADERHPVIGEQVGRDA